MFRKLLFLFALIATLQFNYAQAPGNTCATATSLTLNPGGTISTGLQDTVGFTNDYAAFVAADPCTAAAFTADGLDGYYEINVANAGAHTFTLTNTGNLYKVLSVHSACPVNNTNCLGGIYTAATREGTVDITLSPGTYYIVIDSWYFTGFFYRGT